MLHRGGGFAAGSAGARAFGIEPLPVGERLELVERPAGPIAEVHFRQTVAHDNGSPMVCRNRRGGLPRALEWARVHGGEWGLLETTGQRVGIGATLRTQVNAGKPAD